MTPTVNPVLHHRLAVHDPDWSMMVDRALDSAQVAVDGSERQRLATTLRRLAPAMARTSDGEVSQSAADTVFEQCLLELARG